MSVFKTKTGWRAEATLSIKDKSGRYKRKTKSGFKNKKQAETWLASITIDNGKPTLQKGSITQFKDYFDEYRKLHFESRDLKEATYVAWDAAEKYIVDVYFSNVTLDMITRQSYQAYLNDYSKGKKRNSVAKRDQIIKQVITQAFHDGLIESDPTFGVVIPGAKSKPAEEKFIQVDEFNRLISYIEESDKLIKWRTSFMVYLIALSGIRAGEALALTKDDVDVKNHTINITKTKQRSGESTTPKTESAVRTIAMPNRFFKSYDKFIAAKESWNEKDELFDGRSYATLSNTWLERIEREFGFNNIVSVHGLRHSHVSYLLDKGIDIAYASKRLGHRNIMVTQQIYAHLLLEKQTAEEDKTIKLLDEI
ncbi:tyrosine-type recombinase/integrase [Weissella paramesenteroides]|uniref:tyrosine-type recombinase/integrase n=1 Tax=Weissella paramesenteroides TaxID=1249 RepID=UPI0038578B50